MQPVDNAPCSEPGGRRYAAASQSKATNATDNHANPVPSSRGRWARLALPVLQQDKTLAALERAA